MLPEAGFQKETVSTKSGHRDTYFALRYINIYGKLVISVLNSMFGRMQPDDVHLNEESPTKNRISEIRMDLRRRK